MTRRVETLPPVTAAERARILKSPKDAAHHRALLAEIPAMGTLEVGGTAPRPALPAPLTIAAWNLERGLFPEASADLLAGHGAALVLLSEMDAGMARTGQRNTTAAMAAHMGFAYAYGVEFFEMGLGGPTERAFCKDDHNDTGWHGNAILSAAPFTRLELIRLDADGHWFSTEPASAGDSEQPRLGGRMAIAAEIPTDFGPLCAVTTHLESNADGDYRAAQFTQLLDAVDSFAGDLPIVIGGDLNTGNHMPPDFDWRREALFEIAQTRGYKWDQSPTGDTTRPSLITPHPTRVMRLDWFATRGLTGAALELAPALDPAGQPLSDHECILCRIDGRA